MLEVKSVIYSWPYGVQLEFNLSVDYGDILVIQGASGVGKSTLLSLIAGLLTPQSGVIFWQGKDITWLAPQHRPLSILFQDHNLFEHLDCAANIALGISPALKLSRHEWSAVSAVMGQLGIGGMEKRLPATLSGGQQQRLALARALLRARHGGRSLLLLDEPFSALDPETRQECSAVVRDLVAAENLTALVVSHDPSDVVRLNAKVLAL